MVKAPKREPFQDGVSKPTVLVTGSSGFVGRHLIDLLSRHGMTVVALYRHKLPEPKEGIYPVCSELDSVDLLKAPLRGVDCVVHLAWDHPGIEGDAEVIMDPEFKSVTPNIQKFRNLLKAMEEVGTKKIVFLSAMGANRDTTNKFLLEKYIGEFLTINARIDSRVILRSTALFEDHSNDDRLLGHIAKITKIPGMYPVPKLDGLIGPVHVKDLCETIKRVIEHVVLGSSVGILEICNREQFSVNELFKIIAQQQGWGSKLQVRGWLGDMLTHLVGKSNKFRSDTLDLRSMFKSSRPQGSSGRFNNAYTHTIPESYRSIRECKVVGASI